MFSGKILNHTNVPLSVIYMATTCLLSWRSSIEINSSAFLDDWNPSWVAFAEIWWIFAVAVEVWIRQCPSRVPGMVSLTWISFQGKFVLEKCFFRKGEMFYTCNVLVTKVKQLQRCNNLIRYWSLDTCQGCPSFGYTTNTIRSIFAVWNAKEISSDSQTEFNIMMTKKFEISRWNFSVLLLSCASITKVNYLVDTKQ